MMTSIAASAIRTPQEKLAAILDSHQPRRLLTVSLNPVPVAEHWCDDHDCELIRIQEQNPFDALDHIDRVDMAIVADQLEYMSQRDGESLIGLLRNLHTDSLVAVYQPHLAPEKLRWPSNGFLALGCREEGHFAHDQRELLLYSYDLDSYNFKRAWNNPRFWANPENWGKYWW
ncbi:MULTISPECIES: DUF6231 family protein [Alloalcanivorax]|uniref:Methyltransferase n=1 Tax=Alloalcanivorax balearicus MACL04 TaxID=1177182 RepID=A0ABT2R316_9GAMM|nr:MULTISPECIES: DUF6231 family protein [Alloalcanivorax]MCU5784177.1 hypothetical protein [Alloalcanivorax balearicus MACL04]